MTAHRENSNMASWLGKTVRVVGNLSSGNCGKSYTHGETGLVIENSEDTVIVRMDNTKKYGKPYFYFKKELAD